MSAFHPELHEITSIHVIQALVAGIYVSRSPWQTIEKLRKK